VSETLPILSAAALGALAGAVERGALVAPFGAMQVGRHVAKGEQADALRLIETLHTAGLKAGALVAALRLAEAARRAGEVKPQPSLVWSDLDIAGSRDTAVVCNELFRGARESVLVSTFNLGHKAKDGKAKGNPVLLPLAKRMAEVSSLTVRVFVNLRRLEYMAHASERDVEDAFVGWFRKEIWPWETVPEVYYDPRSLQAVGEESACLHAKCVVVDDARAFVTSANLTEAAQGRNIEAGVLLEDTVFARALRTQFESLIDRGHVRRLTRGLVP
jgi:phosphatidylserine/phosphatidylglycerophosphate/cardiolipin synthase-like enzyme